MNLLKNRLVAFLAALLLPVAAAAQTYPSKSIRLIVPFAPGGTTDVIARLVGQKLSEALGQQVVIDNRPGANGNLGIYKKLPFDPQKDLAPVASVAQVPLLMVVHPGVPVTNVREFVALAKAGPGRINYSSAGHGSSGHLTGELFRALAFTSTRRVPGAPDVPTLTESGYPGLEVLSWHGILAPAGTPQEIVRKLNAGISFISSRPTKA